MARKKKSKTDAPDEEAPFAWKAPGPVATGLGALLSGVKVAPPATVPKARVEATAPVALAARTPSTIQPLAPTRDLARPSESLKGHDRTAFLDALSGVRPLDGRRPVRVGAVAAPAAPPTEEERGRDSVARARLAALVRTGAPIDVHREPDWAQGLRRDSKPSILDALRRATVGPEATLDLHGLRAAEAGPRLARFVRDAQRSGLKRLLIIHGKGNHSEGTAVLQDVVVEVLSRGEAAPLTLGFITAPAPLGGSGALLVELMKR